MKTKTDVKAGGTPTNHNETIVLDNNNQVITNNRWLEKEVHRATAPQNSEWEETLASTLFGSLHPPVHPLLNPSVDYRQSI